MGVCDAPATVPEWEITAQGAKIVKHSSYFTDAKKFLDDPLNERKGIVGVIFRNNYGVTRSCTLLQYYRMIDLFESGDCEVIDWVRSHYGHQYSGLEGYDTEGIGAFQRGGL